MAKGCSSFLIAKLFTMVGQVHVHTAQGDTGKSRAISICFPLRKDACDLGVINLCPQVTMHDDNLGRQ